MGLFRKLSRLLPQCSSWNDIAAEERQPLRQMVGAGELNFIVALFRRLDDNVVHLSHGIGDIELEAGFVALKERVAEILGRHLVAVVERHVVAQSTAMLRASAPESRP